MRVLMLLRYGDILEVEPLATYKHTVLYFLTNLRNSYITESLFQQLQIQSVA